MTKEYTAIRVSKQAKEQAEAAKRDGETWDDYIRRCTENPPEIREFVESANGDSVTSDVDPSELAREVSRQLDYAQLAGKVGDEIEGRLR